MNSEAIDRARMPEGTAVVLDQRTLSSDYPTLLSLLQPGMRVLDVGCGTGTISKGIADAVGPEGTVVGIDSSEHLIERGKAHFSEIHNLELFTENLFTYQPEKPFDLIVSARVLQWLSNPKEALIQFKTLLKPVGWVSILDYNHAQLEWSPAPPASMQVFYQAFLNWRADAGMDNEIADHLPELFSELDFREIRVLDSNEVYQRGQADFTAKLNLWTTVAETRGQQMVQNDWLTEEQRQQTITEYRSWVEQEAESMTMKLKEVRGRV